MKKTMLEMRIAENIRRQIIIDMAEENIREIENSKFAEQNQTFVETYKEIIALQKSRMYKVGENK